MSSTKDNCLRAISRIKETYCKPCGLAICAHDCEWCEAIIYLKNGSGNNPLDGVESQITVQTIFSDRSIREDIAESLAARGKRK